MTRGISASIEGLVPDPGKSLPCPTCGQALQEQDDWVACGNDQCSMWGMSLSVWSVHRRLVAAGRDAPAPGAGWPRPLYDGLPHTYLTPVAAGRAWWRHVDALRLEQCQTQWLCQVCGLRLEHQAWLLVDAGGLVLMSSALHRRCVDLSMARCPALSIEQPTERQVVREQILVNGRPWPLVYATNRPEGILPALWTLATPIA